MNIAVRYCSKFGRTQAIAEEMADELGVKAMSISQEPVLVQHVDVLFLGGAPYWSIMDPALEEYVNRLRPDMVDRVVLFTTSNWSHRTVIGLRTKLEKRGITVAPGHFYAHMSMIDKSKPAARAYAREELNKAIELERSADEGGRINIDKIKELATEVASVLAVSAIVVGGAVIARRVIKLRR